MRGAACGIRPGSHSQNLRSIIFWTGLPLLRLQLCLHAAMPRRTAPSPWSYLAAWRVAQIILLCLRLRLLRRLWLFRDLVFRNIARLRAVGFCTLFMFIFLIGPTCFAFLETLGISSISISIISIIVIIIIMGWILWPLSHFSAHSDLQLPSISTEVTVPPRPPRAGFCDPSHTFRPPYWPATTVRSDKTVPVILLQVYLCSTYFSIF